MKFAGHIFLVILFIAAVGVYAGEQARLNEAAPDFTLKDNNGRSYTLSDFKGKYVVLEWVNFGCPFVGKHYNSGHMQKLQKMYTDKGVIWFTICSSAEGKQGYFEGKELDEKIKEKGVNSTAYLIDEDGSVGKIYGAKTTPHMYVINPAGKLIYVGGIDNRATTSLDDINGATNYVENALDEAMAGKPVVVQTARPYGCSVKYK
jgi:glutathione peroxidase-family protein